MDASSRNKLSGLLVLALVIVAGILYAVLGGSDQKTLLVVLKTLNNPYYVEMKRGLDAAAVTVQDELVVIPRAFDREDDVEGQVAAIRSLLDRQALDVVAIAPASSSKLASIIGELNQKSIPVIVLDTRMDQQALSAQNAKVDAFIGSDNVDGGRKAARFIADNLGGRNGTILFLEGVPSQETAQARKKGFFDGLKNSGVTLPIEERVADWNREKGKSVTELFLATSDVPVAIFGSNDEMALGAIAALADKAVPPDKWPLVVGFDATPDALASVESGDMAATVQQQPAVMGRAAVTLARDLLASRPVDPDQQIGVTLKEK